MEASNYKFTDVIFEIKGKVGILKFNRPKSLNSIGGQLPLDTIHALRVLNDHPDTVFTVITGIGRFFCSGADVLAQGDQKPEVFSSDAVKKVAYMARFAQSMELMRSMITHKKVLVVALNGPAVGAGSAWFAGVADILLAANSTYLQTPFSKLGLVPEFGSALQFTSSLGVHRSNEFFIFGRKLLAEELAQAGMINQIFPTEGFHDHVEKFLEEQLSVNDGKSMMEAKRLQNAPLRDQRLLALYDATDALAERFVDDAPKKRFQQQMEMLRAKSRKRSGNGNL